MPAMPATTVLERASLRVVDDRCTELAELPAGRPAGADSRRGRMFTEIAPRSFRWLGDALSTDGATWIREAEFLATRVA